jgi:hypothetical protein
MPMHHSQAFQALQTPHPPQPIPGRIRTRQSLKPQHRSKPRIQANLAEIFQRPASPMQHEQERLHKLGGGIPDTAPWRWQRRIELAGNVHRMEKLSKESQAAMGRQLLVGDV